MRTPRARIITRWQPEPRSARTPVGAWKVTLTILGGLLVCLALHSCGHHAPVIMEASK